MPPPRFSLLRTFKTSFFSPTTTRALNRQNQPISNLLGTISLSLRDHLSCLLRIRAGAFECTEIDDKHSHMHKPLSFSERWSRQVGRGREERLQKLLQQQRERELIKGEVKGGKEGSIRVP